MTSNIQGKESVERREEGEGGKGRGKEEEKGGNGEEGREQRDIVFPTF